MCQISGFVGSMKAVEANILVLVSSIGNRYRAVVNGVALDTCTPPEYTVAKKVRSNTRGACGEREAPLAGEIEGI